MLADKLDRLLAAFRSHGIQPDLRSGATDAELDQIEEALGLPLPADLRALWAWRNGHAHLPPGFSMAFMFRDSAFIGTPEVIGAREAVLRHATEPEEWRRKTFDPIICIPIAAHGGLTAVSCGPQGDAPHLPNSVIELHGPMYTAYESIEKMVDTNLEICLLYTSPSPRDRQKSRMPSSA